MRVMAPTATMTILDVGVAGQAHTARAENYLEAWYPYPAQITAVGIEDLTELQKRYPQVMVVQTDGKKLPFSDGQFDIVFSNAVIEHVGDTDTQRKFIAECLRVAKRVFITTPARTFPIEVHTLIPFVHWLPARGRNWIYRHVGRRHEAQPGYLTLLSARALLELFPPHIQVTIVRQRLWGLPATLIAITNVRG